MSRVLLIDDDALTVETWAALLRASGFDVMSAGSGADGLSRAIDDVPHVILTDLRLPDISGIELLDRLRTLGIDIPVIVVTGFGTIASAVEAIRLGAVDYVEKPLIGDALIRAVERGLSAAVIPDPRASPRHFACATGQSEAHAARRWATAIARMIDLPGDPKTLSAWGRAIGVSRGTLKNWCRTNGLSSKRSLDFGRLLRAVIRQNAHGIRPEQSLDVVDQRTLSRLLSFAGGRWQATLLPPHVDAFFERQLLIDDALALSELRRILQSK